MTKNKGEKTVLSGIILTDNDKVLYLLGYVPLITEQISPDDFFACTVAMEELAQARKNYKQQQIIRKEVLTYARSQLLINQ